MPRRPSRLITGQPPRSSRTAGKDQHEIQRLSGQVALPKGERKTSKTSAPPTDKRGKENCSPLGYYATSTGDFFPTFRNSLLVLSSSGQKSSVLIYLADEAWNHAMRKTASALHSRPAVKKEGASNSKVGEGFIHCQLLNDQDYEFVGSHTLWWIHML